jgi:acetyl esterase/lipase
MKKKGCIKIGCGIILLVIIVVVVVGLIISYIDKTQRISDVAYGSRPHNTYDLFLPDDEVKQDTLPLILYIHGGAWLGGEKDWHHGDCKEWRKKGYVTATMNYSLLNEKDVSIPTMLEEIDSCIKHIVQYAAAKGIMINQMAICGTSAGGHLAMMYAYSHTHALPLKFAAIKVGPADLRISFPYNKESTASDRLNYAYSCTGKKFDAKILTEERLDSISQTASPVHYINENTALPVIWAYGEKDWLVVPAHYKALKACYDSIKKPYSLIVYPNSDHSLWSDPDCQARYDSTMNAYCKKYFSL